MKETERERERREAHMVELYISRYALSIIAKCICYIQRQYNNSKDNNSKYILLNAMHMYLFHIHTHNNKILFKQPTTAITCDTLYVIIIIIQQLHTHRHNFSLSVCPKNKNKIFLVAFS